MRKQKNTQYRRKKRKTSNDFGCKTVTKQAKKSTVRNEQKNQQKESKQRKGKTEREITTTNNLLCSKKYIKATKIHKKRESGADKNLHT